MGLRIRGKRGQEMGVGGFWWEARQGDREGGEGGGGLKRMSMRLQQHSLLTCRLVLPSLLKGIVTTIIMFDIFF